jgi:hypothetical protein
MVSDDDLADPTVQKSLTKMWGLGQDTTGEELKGLRDNFAQAWRDDEQVKITTGDTDVKRGWFSNIASSAVKGFAGSFIQPIAGVARTVGADTVADYVSENTDAWEYMAPNDKEFDASTTGQYIRGMGQMVGNVSQFVAGGAIAKGVNLARAGYLARFTEEGAAIAKFGAATTAGGKTLAAAELATTASIQTGLQYAMNYGAEFNDTYDSAIEMGMAPEEAYKRSMGYAVAASGIETLSDLALFGKLGAGAALRSNLARINSTATRTAVGAGAGFVAGMPIEGITEGAQRSIQNIALGKDDIWEGVWEEAKIGALVGGTVKAASGGHNAFNIDPKVAPALAESIRKLEGNTTQAINPDESERAPGFAPGTMPSEFEDTLTTLEAMGNLREAVTNGATVMIDGREVGLAVGKTLYTPGPDAGPSLADDAESVPGLESAKLVFKNDMAEVINSGITSKKVSIVPGQAQVDVVGKSALAEIAKIESDDNLTDAQKEDGVLRIADSINARAAVDARYAPLFKVAQGAVNARMFKTMATETREVTGFTNPRTPNLTTPVGVKGMTTEAIERNSARVTVNNSRAILDPAKKGLMVNDKVVTWEELAKPENVVKVSNPITKQVTKPGVEILNTEGITLDDIPAVKIDHSRRDGKTVVTVLADGTTHSIDFKGGKIITTEGRVITRDELKAAKTFIGDSKSYKQEVMPPGTDKNMFEGARLVTKLEEINYQSPKRAMEILAARGDQNSPLAQLLMNSPGIENVRIRTGRFTPSPVIGKDGNPALNKDGTPETTTFAGRYDPATNTIDLNLDAKNTYADNGGRYDILGTYLHEVGHAVLKSRVNSSQTLSAQDKALFDILEEGRLTFMEATVGSTDPVIRHLRGNLEGPDGLDEFMVELGRSPEVQRVLIDLDSRGMVDGKKPNLFRRIMNAILNAISQQDVNPHSQFAKSWRALYDLNSPQNAKPTEAKPNADRPTLYSKGFTVGDYLGLGDNTDDTQSFDFRGDETTESNKDEGDVDGAVDGAWMNVMGGSATPVKFAKDYESRLSNAIDDAWSRIQDPTGWAAKQSDIDATSPTEINAIMQSVYDSQITRATQGLVKQLATNGVSPTEQKEAVNYALRPKDTDNAATRNAKARTLGPIKKAIDEANRLGVFIKGDLKGLGLKPEAMDRFFKNIQGLRGAVAARNSVKLRLSNLSMDRVSHRVLAEDLKADKYMDERAIVDFQAALEKLIVETNANPQDIKDVYDRATRHYPLSGESILMADHVEATITDTEKTYPVAMEIKSTPALPEVETAEFEQLAQEVGKIMDDGTDWNSNRLQAEMNNPAMLIRNAYPQQITEMFDLLLPNESIKGELAVQGAVKFDGTIAYLRGVFKAKLDLKKLPVKGNLKEQYAALVEAYGTKQAADRALFVGSSGKFSNISRHADKVIEWESNRKKYEGEIMANNWRYKLARRSLGEARRRMSMAGLPTGATTNPMAFDGLNQLRLGADMSSEVIREHLSKVTELRAGGYTDRIVPEQKVLDAQEDLERLDSYRQRHLDVLQKYNAQLESMTHAILQSGSPLDLVQAVEGYVTGDTLEGSLGRSLDSLPGGYDQLALLEAQQELMGAAKGFLDNGAPGDLLDAVRNYVEFRNTSKRPLDFLAREINADPYKLSQTPGVVYGSADYTDENYKEEVQNLVDMIPTIRKASLPTAVKTLREMITPGIMDKHAAPRDLWRKLGGGKEQLPITELPRGVVQGWLEGSLKGRSMDKYLADQVNYLKGGQTPLEVANALTAERHLNVTDSGISLRLAPVMKDIASFQSEFRGTPSRKLMTDKQRARDTEVTSEIKDATRTELIAIRTAMKANALEITKVPDGYRKDQLNGHGDDLGKAVKDLKKLIGEDVGDKTSSYFFEEAQAILERLNPNAAQALGRHVKSQNVEISEIIDSADRLFDSLPPGVIAEYTKGIRNILDMLIFDPKEIQNQPHATSHEMIRNKRVRIQEARNMLVTLRDAAALMIPKKDRPSGPVVGDNTYGEGNRSIELGIENTFTAPSDRDKLTYPENNRAKTNRDLRNAVRILETTQDVIAYKTAMEQRDSLVLGATGPMVNSLQRSAEMATIRQIQGMVGIKPTPDAITQ